MICSPLKVWPSKRYPKPIDHTGAVLSMIAIRNGPIKTYCGKQAKGGYDVKNAPSDKCKPADIAGWPDDVERRAGQDDHQQSDDGQCLHQYNKVVVAT